MRISFLLVSSFIMVAFGASQLLLNFEHFWRLIAFDWTATSLLAYLGGMAMFFYELRKLEMEDLAQRVAELEELCKKVGV